MRAKIVSTGLFIPPEIETAAELAPRIGVEEDWILTHTGVRHRHVSDEDMPAMGARAGLDALGDGPPPDLILNASGVGFQVIPDTSTYIQQAMGFSGIPSYSIHATCLSFVVALNTASAMIHSGVYKRILIVSSDQGTRGRNFDEPESAALLGDGAAAVVLEPTPEGEPSEIVAWKMQTFPEGAEWTEVRGGGTRLHPDDPRTVPADNLFHMEGLAVYKMARRRVAVMFGRLFKESGYTPQDVDLMVPHQASGPAVEAVMRYGFPEERVVNIIGETGNCVAASLPMALATAHKDGRMKRGDLVAMAGTGAGLSVAGMLLRW
jgi:3-oxoacyl-[acyl-carrier-protein] synthase III